MRCPECGGKGTVVYPRSKYENGPGTCPACGGSGVKLYGTMYKLKVRNPGRRWVYVGFTQEEFTTWPDSIVVVRAIELDRALLGSQGYVDRNREWGVDGPMEAFVGLEPDE